MTLVRENAESAKKTGGMIALLPASSAELTVDTPDAEPAEDIHVTLQYLGDVTGLDDATREAIVEVARQAVAELPCPIDASVMGHATFDPGGDDQCAVHLIGDSPDLYPLHAAVTAGCAEVLGDDHREQHAPFVAHATAGYGLTAADLSFTGLVVFDRVLVTLAGDRTEIPIPDAIGELARRAYVHGWVLSGGPMTERVKLGCEVAVQLAREHRHDPDVLEATIDIGSLEGTWAMVFQRRHDLYLQHLAAIATAWRTFVAHVDVAAQVAAYRKELGLEESYAGDQTDPDVAAHAQARALLHGAVDPAAADYRALVDVVAAALRDAEAEGKAGAIATTADQLGHPNIRFDLAFDDAQAALGNLDQFWGDAGGWIGKIVNGNAADLGDALARVYAAGGDFDDMLAAADDVLGGADIRALDTLVDMAMSQSFSRGALDLYQQEGVTSVDFLTAGGSTVCPRCLDIESNNPWARDQCPAPGIHPHCRCVVAPSDPLQALRSLDLSRYLPGADPAT